MVVISDGSKVKDRDLGGGFPLPVEIVPFGWEVTFGKLRDRVPQPEAARRQGWQSVRHRRRPLYRRLPISMPIADAAALERDIDTIVGVVDVGLFIGIAKEAFVAGSGG